MQNLPCRLGLTGWGLCAAIAFKGQADPRLLQSLKTAGFQIIGLARNPCP